MQSSGLANYLIAIERAEKKPAAAKTATGLQAECGNQALL
jgi:hypothetical protein